ncbi:MAG: dynamin family protein [Planctomycetes bacterium]|nr:dynamin family protein [Planctomycetota bacterium]
MWRPCAQPAARGLATHLAACMVTQLSSYCQQFDALLRPILTPLQDALTALAAAAPGTPGTGQGRPLTELQHHLRTLCDKVSAQQAYVLIFGPLKSGKSTLMNAIAAAYVSEVSSLPAYPCLVFVGAGKRREYVCTRYDGSQQTFTDGSVLHLHIHDAHGKLAQAIRKAEAEGHVFDPQEHFAQAIRRIDVLVPDSRLQQTGAVLVDTPGLYTRMRFGYDRMTRDFRDAAACAIFVVKSDTLFLEQVFAEFQQLLELFSRIFLVVNVDAHKRDVGPDGKLVPSLEQSQPEAVLAAFERLAMSAPLQRAAAEGKVRMYPVDLLHAASSSLQKEPLDKQPQSFQRFQKDLTDYLGSHEYLAAFLRDSLQRANLLLGEVSSTCTASDIRTLQAQLADLRERHQFVTAEQRRLALALQFDWLPTAQKLHKALDDEIERTARDTGQKLLRTLGASIDTWFLSSHSLDWLVAGQWTPLVSDYRDEVLRAGKRALEQAQGQPSAGLDLPDGVGDLLHRFGIDLRNVRQQALAALGGPAWKGKATVPIDPDQIPIKRGMLDVVAFRSVDKVRHRLFGDKPRPDQKIPGKEKAARLGEPGRLFLHQQITAFRGELAPATIAAVRHHLGEALMKAMAEALQKQLRTAEPRLQQARVELESEIARLQAVLQPVQALATTAGDLQGKLSALATRFGSEFRPAPATGPVLTPQPRRGRHDSPARPHNQPERR